MAQVNVTIAGRAYRMACMDGEEEHLTELARQVDAKIAEMRTAFGEIGDQRLTVMAAITVLDEMSEVRRRLADMEAKVESLTAARDGAASAAEDWADDVADVVERAAQRIEAIAQRMNAEGRKG